MIVVVPCWNCWPGVNDGFAVTVGADPELSEAVGIVQKTGANDCPKGIDWLMASGQLITGGMVSTEEKKKKKVYKKKLKIITEHTENLASS